MPSQEAIIIPPGVGPQCRVLGDLVTVKIHSHETGGVYSQIETTCGPQIGPPLHLHQREDETFFVIEGEFEFVCGDKTVRGGPGTVARLPRGVPHRFKNIGDQPGRVLITITPGGFEVFLTEVGKLTPEEQTNFPRIIELATRFGLEFVQPA